MQVSSLKLEAWGSSSETDKSWPFICFKNSKHIHVMVFFLSYPVNWRIPRFISIRLLNSLKEKKRGFQKQIFSLQQIIRPVLKKYWINFWHKIELPLYNWKLLYSDSCLYIFSSVNIAWFKQVSGYLT